MRKDAPGERTVRRIRWLPDHPLASAGGYVSQARVALYEKIGPGPHECHWCGSPIRWVVGQRGNGRDVVVADHVDSDPLNDDPSNLVPSCGRCNGGRGRWVSDDAEYVVRLGGTRLRVGEKRLCKHCGAEFLTSVSRRNYCGKHVHAAYRT